MSVIKRPFRLLSDFAAVHQFLADTYTLPELNSMMIPQFFEYALTHPHYNHKLSHRNQLWEEQGRIVAFCGFEMNIGEAFLVCRPSRQHLLPAMLAEAEQSLAIVENGEKKLSVWVTDAQDEHIRVLQDHNYSSIFSEPVRIFRYDQPFQVISLPAGYTCHTLAEENDLVRLHRCLHRGFNHEGEPDDDLDCRRQMQSGPNYRFDLSTVIKAPNGDYACYAGMWLDSQNHYAYLEPLCTMPEYRRKGLATYALTRAMQKTQKLGATYCFGGVPAFYPAIGFTTIVNRLLCRKNWPV